MKRAILFLQILSFSFVLGLALLVLRVNAESRWVSLNTIPGDRTEISVLSSDDFRTVIRVTVPGMSVADFSRNGETFQVLTIPDAGTSTDEGKPQLPLIRRLVAVPPDRGIHLKILKEEHHLLSGYRVVPYQKPPLRGESQVEGWVIDETFYSKDDYLPESPVRLEEPVILRDFRAVPLVIEPVSYNPVRGELMVTTQIVVELSYAGAGTGNVKTRPYGPRSRAFDGIYRRTLLNYDQVASTTELGDEGRMLIITHDNFYDNVIPLAEWKHRKGIPTTVVALSEIGANPSPDEIKDFISDAYFNWGVSPEYVLFVGDVQYIPWWVGVHGSRTDHRYATLEGDDFLADVILGRFSVQTPAEADTVVQKSIAYERDPYLDETNWYTSAMVIASADNLDPENGQLAANLFINHGFTTVDELQEIQGTATFSAVENGLNQGRSWVFYIGHGSPNGWTSVHPNFTTGDIDSLTHGHKIPAIISIACSNADLDRPGDVFGEVWMKGRVSGGAANFLGFTELVSFYTSDSLGRGVLYGYFDENIHTFGGATDYGRLFMYQYFGSTGQETMEQCIVLGDPEQNVWSGLPVLLTVIRPEMARIGCSEYEVGVFIEGNPVEGALVCVLNDELYASGYTEEDGGITLILDPPPQTPGEDLFLTVTAHNALPYIDTVQVGGWYGVLTGAVTDAATGDSLAEAVVTVGEIGLVDTTGEDGLFLFEEVPEWNYTVTVTREGYLDWYQEGVVVDSGQTTVLDAGLLHPEFVVDVDSSGIHITLLPGGETNVVFNILNPGNGPLEYGIGLEYPGWTDSVNLDQPLFSYDLGMLTGDERLLGVEFDSSFFYVSGANNSAQPNYIYVFDRDGNLVRAFEQPGGSAGWGFRDLAWDGQFLYGSFGPEITVFDPVGNYVGGIPGPIQPSRAIAYDPGTDHFWVAGVNTGLYEIDRQGDVISSYPCSLRVYGLAWRGDDLEGANLHLFSREGTDQVSTVSKFNPSRGELIPLGSLPFMDGDRAMGAALTGDWIPAKWVLLGLINGPTVRLEGYIVGDNLIWVRPSPREGTVAGGEAQSVIVHLNTVGLEEGTYTGEIHIQHSAVGEEGVIPVTLTVQGLSVSEEESFGLPTDYELFQNYPNPFNPSTTIRYGLPEPGRVTLKVYNISGQEVATLVNENQPAGYYKVHWDATYHSSGIYFFKIAVAEAGGQEKFMAVRKMIYIK